MMVGIGVEADPAIPGSVEMVAATERLISAAALATSIGANGSLARSMGLNVVEAMAKVREAQEEVFRIARMYGAKV